jgi:diguanylate cyclase (GGDEF)-like protein
MVAKSIKSLIRTTDRGFRYGGEEFCILLPETTKDNGALLAERLRQRIENDHSVQELSVTISLGIVDLLPLETPESFIKRADNALYAAKKGGRNRVIIG